jgi:peptidoglycan/LPS O-acetylase OafA/YrhL
MRAMAIALVLLAHASQTHGFKPMSLRWIAVHGAVGVDVFFVISGFLITTLMLREIARTKSISVSAFYIRRALRILPAYLCFLTTILVLNLANVVQLQQRDWTAALTYTVNFIDRPKWEIGHVWSLSIEEHFYLLWPLVMVTVSIAVAKHVAVALIIACFCARWLILLALPRWSQMAELWTFTRLDSIAFGCLMALATWDKRWRSRLDDWCQRKMTVPCAVLVLICSVYVFSRSAKYSVGFGYTLNAAIISLLLWASIRRSGTWFGRVLNHWAVAAIGVGSYSLYLWQQILLNPTKDVWFVRFPQNVLLVFAIAAISYILIERPFLRLKDNVAVLNPSRDEAIRTVAGEPALAGGCR